MSKLETFLENFDLSTKIKLFDENGNVVFEGEMGDISKKILNMQNVIRGTAKVCNGCVEVQIKKS